MLKQDTILPAPSSITVRKKTSFLVDVLKLVSGTTLAQLLNILAAPFMTRLYEPKDFGVWTLFLSLIGILGVAACLRYELAIMLSANEEEAANLLGISLSFALIVSLMSAIIIFCGHGIIISWLNVREIAPYLWLVSPTVLILGCVQSFNYWNSRAKRFGRLSSALIISGFIMNTCLLIAGYIGYGRSSVMIVSSIASQAIMAMLLGYQIWLDNARLFKQAISWKRMLVLIKRYRKFPYYDTWGALLNAASWQLPVFMLSSYFSSTVVGYYGLAFRILQMPMSMLGTAIGQVFFQRAVDARAEGQLPGLVENVFSKLVMLGLFPMLILTLIGRDLFVVLFGRAWIESGLYVQMLGLWAFCWFVSSPLSTLFSTLERQEHMLRWNLANFGTRFASLWIGGVLHNPRLAIGLFSISGVIVYGYIIISILVNAGVPLQRSARIVGANLLIFLPVGTLLIYLSIINAYVYIKLLTVAIFCICYLLYLVRQQWNFVGPIFRRVSKVTEA